MINKPVSKATIIACLCFIYAPGLLSEEKRELTYIWQGHTNLPNPKSTEKVLPDRGDGHIRVTNINNPSIEFFAAKGGKKNAPAIILCPGGGYRCLVVSKMHEIATWLNDNGIHAFVLKYRLPNQRAKAFEDLQRSIRIVRANAAKWKIDPDKIGVLGSSAGGHLAATVSAGYQQASYRVNDEIDKVSAKPDFTILLYPAYLNKGNALAKGLTVPKEQSPTIILSAKNDRRFFQSSVVYSNALKDIGVSVRVHFFDKGGHGFGLHVEDKEASKWPELCLKWLKDSNVLNK